MTVRPTAAMNVLARAFVRWLAAALLVTLAHLAPVSAQNAFERLVMPGDLIKGHAKYEKECKSCHTPFSKGAQSQLCLDCHKDVAADVRDKKGLHGLRKDIAAKACSHCHGDHKGRDADIVQLDTQTFDHASTDFALIGAHAAVACKSCHAPEKKYREAPSDCHSCHKASDPHRGALGVKCASCHDEKSWRKTKPYDHDKTNFKLTGSHVDVGCRACHVGELWKGAPTKCVDCHRAKDSHKGRNGPKCESCHKTTTWDAITFNHDKDTKFPLLGKHRARCDACHKADPKVEKLAITCMPCHTKEDVHKGNLGKDCQKCHNESGWKIGTLLNHDKDTRFPLVGKHAVTKCADCHKAKDDNQPRDFREAPRTCVGCHAKKDAEVHAGRLGAKCESCHNSKSWKEWRYDHAREAKFALTGRHAKISCYACHQQKNVQKITLPRTCIGCHQQDDKHRGAFGRDCERCHSTSTFSSAFIRR